MLIICVICVSLFSPLYFLYCTHADCMIIFNNFWYIGTYTTYTWILFLNFSTNTRNLCFIGILQFKNHHDRECDWQRYFFLFLFPFPILIRRLSGTGWTEALRNILVCPSGWDLTPPITSKNTEIWSNDRFIKVNVCFWHHETNPIRPDKVWLPAVFLNTGVVRTKASNIVYHSR